MFQVTSSTWAARDAISRGVVACLADAVTARFALSGKGGSEHEKSERNERERHRPPASAIIAASRAGKLLRREGRCNSRRTRTLILYDS
jgi:hypothetical protein